MKRLTLALMLVLAAISSSQAIIINTLPFTLTNGTTADASQVMANFNQIVANANANAAATGSNADITALTALTAPPAGLGSEIFYGSTIGGTNNAITVAASLPTNFSLRAGNIVSFIPTTPNSGATTLNFLSTGVKNILKLTINGLAALQGGEIIISEPVLALYDGTQFVLMNRYNDPGLVYTAIASAATTSLSVPTSNKLNITGVTTITSFGTSTSVGDTYYLRFDGRLQITYNAASMITLTAANVITHPGDTAVVQYLGSSQWKFLNYEYAQQSAGSAVEAQVGTSYTLTSSDCGGTETFNNASATAVTLPQATGAFISCTIYVHNIGAGLVTITPSVSTIDGATSMKIGTGGGAILSSDGTNWQLSSDNPQSTQRILLNTLTASSSATLADTTSFTSAFNEYEIIFDNITTSVGLNSCLFQVNVAGVQTTGYTSQYLSVAGGTASSAAVTNAIPCSATSTAATSAGVSGYFRVSRPAATGNYKVFNGQFTYGQAAGPVDALLNSGGAFVTNTNAVTGFQLSWASGNIASGTIKVYGWR